MTSILLTILALLLNGNAQTYNTKDLTSEILTNRTAEVVIVEEINGIVLDDEGNGIDENGNYISYKNVDSVKGEIITTYCIYNPNTNFEDDIIYRIDFKSDGNVYIN